MTYDITRNYHGGNTESVEANKRAGINKSRDRWRIVEFMVTRGRYGATCYEAEEALGMSHQTCSARFSDLKKDRVLSVNGIRRPTNTGCLAAVCVISVLL